MRRGPWEAEGQSRATKTRLAWEGFIEKVGAHSAGRGAEAKVGKAGPVVVFGLAAVVVLS